MIEILFKNILQASIIGSVGIIFVMILRKSLLREYTEFFKYYIWLAVIVQMLIPFKIPILMPKRFNFKGQDLLVYLPGNLEKAGSSSNIDVFKILGWIWLITAVVFLVHHIIVYLKFKNKIRYLVCDVYDSNIKNLYQNLISEMNMKWKINLKLCRGISSPMVIGILKPCILLPKASYKNEEIKWILKHELIHYKKHDILYKIVLILTMAIHWFNPLVYIMWKIMNSDCELACDEAVLKDSDIEERKVYALTLVDSMKRNRKDIFQHGFSTGFNVNENMLKRRFENMFNIKRKKRGIASGILIVAISAASLVSFKVFAEDNTNTMSTKPEITEVNKDNTVLSTRSATVVIDVATGKVIELQSHNGKNLYK